MLQRRRRLFILANSLLALGRVVKCCGLVIIHYDTSQHKQREQNARWHFGASFKTRPPTALGSEVWLSNQGLLALFAHTVGRLEPIGSLGGWLELDWCRDLRVNMPAADPSIGYVDALRLYGCLVCALTCPRLTLYGGVVVMCTGGWNWGIGGLRMDMRLTGCPLMKESGLGLWGD